jgi:small subunit ribosomal protein S7
MIFGKWDINEVKLSDPSLQNYINLGDRAPHSHGKHSKKQFGKSDLTIVERVTNNLMRSASARKVGGHWIIHRFGTGKKTKATKALMAAMEIIAEKAKENPVQVLVRAVENAAPREETTRVKWGGVTRHLAVDISPQRRLDFALHNIAIASLAKSYKSTKSWGEALADELLLAAANDANSQSVAKKIEVERVAKGAR